MTNEKQKKHFALQFFACHQLVKTQEKDTSLLGGNQLIKTKEAKNI